MIAVLNWSLNHWWIFLWLSIFGVFEGVRDFFLGCAEGIADLFSLRHRRKLELAKAQAKAAGAQAAAAVPSAGLLRPSCPCGHPDAWTPEAIIYSGTRVTFLFVTCMSCGWQGQVEPSAMPKEQAE